MQTTPFAFVVERPSLFNPDALSLFHDLIMLNHNRAETCGRIFICLAICTSASAMADTLAIAHRGLARVAPENTLAAFQSAHGKADIIEFDVRVSGDYHLVVIHDATVDRTTNGSGSVSNMTLAELRLLDAGSWYSPAFSGQKIPTLTEAITNVWPFATPLIEHKAGSPALYVRALRDLNMSSSVMLQSFDWQFLRAAKELEPSLFTCALGYNLPMNTDWLQGAKRHGVNAISWHKSSITPEGLALARSLDLMVFAWTIAEQEVSDYLELGVDGIIGNAPDHVIFTQHPTPSVIFSAIQADPHRSDLIILETITRGLSSGVFVYYMDSLLNQPGLLTPLQIMVQGRTRTVFFVSVNESMRGFFRVNVMD